MPLTIRLNPKVIQYLGPDRKVDVYNDLIRITRSAFKFEPNSVEVWINSSNVSLGGHKTEALQWEDLNAERGLLDLVSSSVELDGILIINGSYENGEKTARIKIPENNREKRVYSDFFFETSAGLYDELKENDASSMIMSQLFEDLDKLSINFETNVMGHKTMSKRRIVKNAFISDNVPDIMGRMEETSFLFMLQPMGNESTFVRYIMRNVGTKFKEKYDKDPLELFDSNKIAKRVSDISRKKGYFPEKYVSVKTGSIAYIARPHGDLDRMFEDYTSKVMEPILKNLYEQAKFDELMENSIEGSGPGSLDKY